MNGKETNVFDRIGSGSRVGRWFNAAVRVGSRCQRDGHGIGVRFRIRLNGRTGEMLFFRSGSREKGARRVRESFTHLSSAERGYVEIRAEQSKCLGKVSK